MGVVVVVLYEGKKKKMHLPYFLTASAAPPPAHMGAPPEPVGHLAAQNEEEKCVYVIARNVSNNRRSGTNLVHDYILLARRPHAYLGDV
jgi:hypothetical protein